MEAWTDFFVAEVGAAAVLAGLLVVAVSINLTRIMEFALLPLRVAQTLTIVGGVLVVASAGLIPGQSDSVFGTEAALIGSVVLVAGGRFSLIALSVRNPNNPMSWTLFPFALVALSSFPIIVGGGLLATGMAGGLYWIAAGVIAGFIATLHNGWVLLIEILH
jgi:modulator of FtsH protease